MNSTVEDGGPRSHVCSPSSTPAEIFLQSHLQTSPPTPQKSYAKFWNHRIPKNCIVWGERGVPNFLGAMESFFVLLLGPHTKFIYLFNYINPISNSYSLQGYAKFRYPRTTLENPPFVTQKLHSVGFCVCGILIGFLLSSPN